MKKISKYICSIMTVVVLAFNTAVIPALNVQATSLVVTYGITEILQSLLLSAGISYLGYQVTNKVSIDKKALVQANSDEIKNALAKAQELDEDSSFAAELEAAAEGTEFNYDGFKIAVGSSGYKVYASKALVESAAKSIKTWTESDENTYEGAVTSNMEDYFSVTYSNSSSVLSASSIDDISSLYSSKVTEAINELGYDDSNSMVLSYNLSAVSVTETRFFSDSLGDLLTTGTYTVFIPIPFGYSYVCKDISAYAVSGELGNSSGRFYETTFLNSLVQYYENYGASGVVSYIKSCYDTFPVVVYYPILDEIQVRQFSATLYLPSMESPIRLYNYERAFDKDSNYLLSLYIHDKTDSTCKVLAVPVTQYYITSGASSKYANENDYVSMDFDATTAETLTSYESLAEYIAYATSLSAQLSDIKDAIEDSTEQNAAQAAEIVSAINAQTSTLSGDIADVITTVKVQTDAIDDVLEATIAQTDAIGDVITGIDDATLAITGPLEDILEAIQDLTITLPSDLTLSIPEEIMNITVQVPDISTEVINQIEVTQDYPALQEAIAGAIAAPLEAVFVPDEDKVYGLVDDFHHKFSFVDDMKTNVDNIQKYVFGVTPSPILKIPIMKVNSKYDYGFGDYFIIDISWYEPYRSYGDLIILAFAWLMFIWRVFVSLPGIISGASGGIWNNSSVAGSQSAIGVNDPTLIEDKRRGH